MVSPCFNPGHQEPPEEPDCDPRTQHDAATAGGDRRHRCCHRQRQRRPNRGARIRARDRGGERRRQVHIDEDPLRGAGP